MSLVNFHHELAVISGLEIGKGLLTNSTGPCTSCYLLFSVKDGTKFERLGCGQIFGAAWGFGDARRTAVGADSRSVDNGHCCISVYLIHSLDEYVLGRRVLLVNTVAVHPHVLKASALVHTIASSIVKGARGCSFDGTGSLVPQT